MKIVVTGFKPEGYICEPFRDGTTLDYLDRKKFKEWLSVKDNEVYFACVEDKTWKKWKTKNAKRVELTLDELLKLIEESDWLILIKGNHAEACIIYDKHTS
jgi:hypothetical protein